MRFNKGLYTDWRLLNIFVLGFSSGLPFLLTLSTLSFWLSEEGISKSTIGLFMLTSLPYSLKFLWAPFFDTFKVPFLSKILGKWKSWAFVVQVSLMGSLCFLSFFDPKTSIGYTALGAFLVAFFAASQDILIDTFRIEVLRPEQSGIGAALETIGFRFGMIASGAGALFLATTFSWGQAYRILSYGVIFGILSFLFLKEPNHLKAIEKISLESWFVRPWKDFPYKSALKQILLMVLALKGIDTVLSAMSAPFLCELGYSKIEYASVTKVFGITWMVLGGVAGGFMLTQFSLKPSLFVCLLLQVIASLMFLILNVSDHNLNVLVIAIGIESFASGITSTCFISYLSGFCKK